MNQQVEALNVGDIVIIAMLLSSRIRQEAASGKFLVKALRYLPTL